MMALCVKKRKICYTGLPNYDTRKLEKRYTLLPADAMKKTLSYLSQTKKNGWYGYRRRVPQDIADLIKERVWVISYRTKDRGEAFAAHKETHQKIEEIIRLARSSKARQQSEHSTSLEGFTSLKKSLAKSGLLPHQLKYSNASHPKELVKVWSEQARVAQAFEAFDADLISYSELKLELKDLVTPEAKKTKEYFDLLGYVTDTHEIYKDSAVEKDIVTGFPNGGETGVAIPSSLVATRKLLEGDYEEFEPTLEGALGYYLQKSRKKERNPQQQQKLERDMSSLIKLVGDACGGATALLSDLDQELIEERFNQAKPNASTRRRAYTALSALIATWNKGRASGAQVGNPFLNLKEDIDPEEVRANEKLRKIWSPREYFHFCQSVRNDDDNEIKIIGLLLAYAGKPQGETKGLVRDDLVLNSDPPHLRYRRNNYRTLAKGRLETSLPLVDLIEEEVRSYASNFQGSKDDLLFPRAYATAPADLTKKLKKHMVEFDPISGESFVPYGLRHTFKVRAEKAGVPLAITQYIFGHVDDASREIASRITRGYAKGYIPEELKNEITQATKRINSMEYWDQRKPISDFD